MLLPQPDGPTIEQNSPGLRDRHAEHLVERLVRPLAPPVTAAGTRDIALDLEFGRLAASLPFSGQSRVDDVGIAHVVLGQTRGAVDLVHVIDRFLGDQRAEGGRLYAGDLLEQVRRQVSGTCVAARQASGPDWR